MRERKPPKPISCRFDCGRECESEYVEHPNCGLRVCMSCFEALLDGFYRSEGVGTQAMELLRSYRAETTVNTALVQQRHIHL